MEETIVAKQDITKQSEASSEEMNKTFVVLMIVIVVALVATVLKGIGVY